MYFQHFQTVDDLKLFYVLTVELYLITNSKLIIDKSFIFPLVSTTRVVGFTVYDFRIIILYNIPTVIKLHSVYNFFLSFSYAYLCII